MHSACTIRNEEFMRKVRRQVIVNGGQSTIQKENVIFPQTLVLLWLEACVSFKKEGSLSTTESLHHHHLSIHNCSCEMGEA